MQIPRFNVLGVSVSGMNLGVALEAMLGAIALRRKGYVCVTGVHGIIEAQDDPEFRRILNASFLTTTDGMPLVWLGRRALGPGVNRVYGPDLMLHALGAMQPHKVRHFFYGGAPGVAEELREKMQERFPDAIICGTWTPPFRPLTEAEEAEFKEVVRVHHPDIIWVGLSTPKQERFMARYLDELSTVLMVGVGAAFDFHSGRVRQAPVWVQRSGFEWLYRMLAEPRRLARRYLVNNPRFLALIALQLFGLRKYPLETGPGDA